MFVAMLDRLRQYMSEVVGNDVKDRHSDIHINTNPIVSVHRTSQSFLSDLLVSSPNIFS